MALLSTEKGENLRAVQVACELTAEKNPSKELQQVQQDRGEVKS